MSGPLGRRKERIELKITRTENGSSLCLALEGRLDTNTAPELESELKGRLDSVKELTIDMAELSYLSSAGLRVLLGAQKTMNRQGGMRVTNVNETVMEIFEITGFLNILTVE